MKQFIKLSFAALIGAFACSSCNNSSDSTTTSDTSATKMTTTTPATNDTSASAASMASTSSPEQDFINFAAPANTKEIIWLKAGIDKGSKEIKEHATHMLKDHEGLKTKVAAYLQAHPAIKEPSVDTSNVVTINDKTGKDWDKAWIDKMVTDHQDLLDFLNKQKTVVKDPDLLAIINPLIPTVQSHLDMAKMLQNKK